MSIRLSSCRFLKLKLLEVLLHRTQSTKFNNPLTIQHVVNIRLLVNRITAGHSSLLILIVSRSAVA